MKPKNNKNPWQGTTWQLIKYEGLYQTAVSYTYPLCNICIRTWTTSRNYLKPWMLDYLWYGCIWNQITYLNNMISCMSWYSKMSRVSSSNGCLYPLSTNSSIFHKSMSRNLKRNLFGETYPPNIVCESYISSTYSRLFLWNV